MSWSDLDAKIARIRAKLAFLNLVLGAAPYNTSVQWESQELGGLAFILSEIHDELGQIHQQILVSKPQEASHEV